LSEATKVCLYIAQFTLLVKLTSTLDNYVCLYIAQFTLLVKLTSTLDNYGTSQEIFWTKCFDKPYSGHCQWYK